MNTQYSQLLDFMRILGKLKDLKREGWVKRGVSDPESVASHMYRMAMMSLVLPIADSQLDRARAVKMALVHDAAEAIVGDITPECGVSVAEKHRRETEALTSMTSLLEASQAAEVTSLFEEYEANETREARLVHDLDKLDMIMQADQYESDGRVRGSRDAAALQEFFDSTSHVFTTSHVLPLVDELRRQRTHRLNSETENTQTQQ